MINANLISFLRPAGVLAIAFYSTLGGAHAGLFDKIKSPLQQLESTFSDEDKEEDSDSSQQSEKSKSSQGAMAVGGALVGGIIGHQIDDDNGRYIGALAGGLLASQFLDQLTEKEQEQLVSSTQATVETDEAQTWTNPETGTKITTKVVDTGKVSESLAIPVQRYGRAAKVNVPPLELVGESYKAVADVNVHVSPDANSPVALIKKAGRAVEIIGKVKDQNWYYVAQNGQGVGYAGIQHFSESAVSKGISVPVAKEPEDGTQVVEIEREYKTIQQEIVLADGTVTTEEIKLVKNADGKWEKVS